MAWSRPKSPTDSAVTGAGSGADQQHRSKHKARSLQLQNLTPIEKTLSHCKMADLTSPKRQTASTARMTNSVPSLSLSASTAPADHRKLWMRLVFPHLKSDWLRLHARAAIDLSRFDVQFSICLFANLPLPSLRADIPDLCRWPDFSLELDDLSALPRRPFRFQIPASTRRQFLLRSRFVLVSRA